MLQRSYVPGIRSPPARHTGKDRVLSRNALQEGCPLFAVDIVRPLFDDSLGRSASPVMPLPGGGPVLLCLFLVIDIGCFLGRFCGSRCLLHRPGGQVSPEMVPLAARVPALPPVPPVTPPLPGLVLRGPGLLGLRSR